MAISKKRAPVVQDPQLARVISKIYDDMNEIINSVNQGDSTLVKTATEGKPGDLRVMKDSNSNYFIEARTDEGWIRNIDEVSVSGGAETISVGLQFKERN